MLWIVAALALRNTIDAKVTFVERQSPNGGPKTIGFSDYCYEPTGQDSAGRAKRQKISRAQAVMMGKIAEILEEHNVSVEEANLQYFTSQRDGTRTVRTPNLHIVVGGTGANAAASQEVTALRSELANLTKAFSESQAVTNALLAKALNIELPKSSAPAQAAAESKSSEDVPL